MNATASLANADVSLLIQYLNDEIVVQSAVIDYLHKKETILIKQDAAALATVMEEGEPILQQVEELTQRRVRVLTSLGRRIGLDTDDITLSAVIAAAPEGARQELLVAQSTLKERLSNAGLRNRRISVLIRHALDVNRGLVAALFGNETQSASSYGRTGIIPPVSPTSAGLNREL